MKELIKTIIFSSGFRVGRHTKLEDLKELIHSLQPEICGRELIRVGGDADGGYLLPDDLDGIEYCFSPGVSSIADFENQLADRGIRSFMADYSVKEPPLMRPEFCFERKVSRGHRRRGLHDACKLETEAFGGLPGRYDPPDGHRRLRI